MKICATTKQNVYKTGFTSLRKLAIGASIVAVGTTSLNSCKSSEEMDLIKSDYTSAVANGPVSKRSLEIGNKFGIILPSNISPIQTVNYSIPDDSLAYKYKISDKSTADTVRYTGSVENLRNDSTKELQVIETLGNNNALVIEQQIKDPKTAKWLPYDKSEINIDEKGYVAQYKDGKSIAEYKPYGMYTDEGGLNIYKCFSNGTKKKIDNFVASQVYGTMKSAAAKTKKNTNNLVVSETHEHIKSIAFEAQKKANKFVTSQAYAKMKSIVVKSAKR